MGNPATLLLELFRRWDAAEGNAGPGRGLSADGELSDADADHLDAMRWITQLRDELATLAQQGRRVDTYQRQLGHWTHIVLNYPGSWGSRPKPELITQPMLDILENLSDLLDAVLPHFSEEQRTTARGLLDDVVSLLREDEDLPEDIRAYVYRVVQHAKTCIEDFEVVGELDLKAALDQLWGALKAAEGHSKGRIREAWKFMGEKIFTPATVLMLGSAPTIAAQAIQLGAG